MTELTEGEPVNQEYMRQKIAVTKAWNGLIAIDDFGAGYNSETVLLDMEPDIIKVDTVSYTHLDVYKRQM